MKSPVLSPALQEYSKELGVDPKRLLETYAKPLPDAFRVNTLKTNDKAMISALEGYGFVLRKVPWTEHGYIAESASKRLAATHEFISGLIYIQGPVSMAVTEALAPNPGDYVLDMCAAPGGKSVHILQRLDGKGELVSNEKNRDRLNDLSKTLQKSAAKNYSLMCYDGRAFRRIKEGGKEKYAGQFDRVLIDAPCSNLGTASRDWTVARDWKPIRSKRLSNIQFGLLFSGYECLKPGGTLVYSTCTFTAEENEIVVAKLLKRTDAEISEVNLNGLIRHNGLTTWRSRGLPPALARCARIYPFDNGAEGFFIAKIRKPEAD